MKPLGEWHYPNGNVVRGSQAFTMDDGFFRIRSAPQVISLVRRVSANPLSPTGPYCCVVPTIAGERKFCAKISKKY